MRKSITLLGSSGLVGSNVLQLGLISADLTKIHTIGRKSLNLRHPKLEEIICDNNNYHEVSSFFATDILICCLGTTIKQAQSQAAFRAVDFELTLKAAKIFKEQGGEHFILLSAIGANSSSRIFYNQVKGELENELKKIGFEKLTIVRPSLLLGVRKESRPLEKFAQAISPITNLLLLGSWQKYRAVEAQRVAIELLAHALNQQQSFQIEYLTIPS